MLYIVATPIGNMGDITYRAVETLKSVDVIACEDTRNSQKLLNHYEIHKPLITYHKFNETVSTQGILKLLDEGKDVALISDGGMPLISDPGNILTRVLHEKGVSYTVVPGPNAALSALVLSGLDATKFTFIGFLPEKNSKKEEILLNYAEREETLIFHVSCHNLKEDIQLISKIYGKRKASLVKEITKMHETIIDFNLGDEIEVDQRGEFVLVVEGNNKNNSKLIKNNDKIIIENKNELINQVEKFEKMGLKRMDAIKLVAKENKVKKDEIYKLFNK